MAAAVHAPRHNRRMKSLHRGTGLGVAVIGIAVGLVPFLADQVGWTLNDAEVVVLAILVAGLLIAGIAIEVLARRQPRLREVEISIGLDAGSPLGINVRPGEPQIVLMEVVLTNPNPFNLEGIAVNVWIPQGLCLGRCGLRGEPAERGHWLTEQLQLSSEPASGAHKDFWADEGISIAGNGSKLLFFKLCVADPGEHYLKVQIFGDVPKHEALARLDVRLADSITFGGTIGELIYRGEHIQEGPETVFSDQAHRGAHGDFTVQLAFLTGMIPDEDRAWWHRVTNGISPAGSGAIWRSQLAADHVPHLYELRRRLARPA